MNKTVTININGLIFNIDDEAYAHLKTYLDTIKGYFKNAEGGEDIMIDIEARIAEMFQERISDRKEVISSADVDYMVSVMGQPEDYIDEEMRQEAESFTNQEHDADLGEEDGPKRFFRDPDNKMLGGVCSGIGYYFGIDPIIARAIFLFAFIFGSFGFWVYLILWVITPKAVTRADKLRMKGKKVTIESIRKSVENEAGNLKKKWKNLGSEVPKQWNEKSKGRLFEFGTSLLSFLGNVLQLLLKGIGKLLGLLFFVIGGFWLFVLITSLFGLYSFDGDVFFNQNLYAFTIDEFNTLIFNSPSSKYIILTGVICTIGIPLLALTYSGLRLLFGFTHKFRGIGIGLFVLWFLGIITLVLGSLNVASEFKQSESVSQEIALSPTLADTLIIEVNPELLPPYEDPSKTKDDHYLLKRDSEYLYLANVKLNVVENNSDSILITVTQKARGATYKDAKSRAKKIEYFYSISDNKLVFDPYYKVAFQDQYRLQEVYVQISIPRGKSVYFSDNSAWVIHDIKNVNNTWDFDMINQYWIMTDQGLHCKACPAGSNKKYNVSSSADYMKMEIAKLEAKIQEISLDFEIEKSKTENEFERKILSWKNKIENASSDKKGEYELKVKELEVQLEQSLKRLDLKMENSLRKLEFKKDKLIREFEQLYPDDLQSEEDDAIEEDEFDGTTAYKITEFDSVIKFPNPFSLVG
ncbi:MAG: PspC domain-containing protein [Flavobacteriales bacterium]|nr:PspC domain-containing protein [Flavobacteriales bacterium]